MGVLRVFAAACLAFAPVCAANAVLAGAGVSESYTFPSVSTPYDGATYAPQNFVVGAGEESVIDVEGVTNIHVDFADTSLGLQFDTILSSPYWTNTDFNGVIFTSAAFAAITNVSLAPTSNFVGFDTSRVSIVGNELRLNWAGLSYDGDTRVDFVFNNGGVPEPASWAMMIAGFGATGFALRRRNRLALA